MADTPSSEILINESLVRALIVDQAAEAIPDAATLPLARIAAGWDNEIWRLGSDLAVRLPRRALAAALIEHEQSVLPILAPRLARAGVSVPLAVHHGSPSADYPWNWSITPWYDGSSALTQPRHERGDWAPTLAHALIQLHVEAPAAYPHNRYRGQALITRADTVSERIATLRTAGALSAITASRASARWQEGLRVKPWNAAPVWIHGDLHPGNLVIRAGTLDAIIDFGDVTAGDPAYDLAAAWIVFDRSGRASFRAATSGRYDDTTWTRARAWAVAIAVMLLTQSDDNPRYSTLGAETLDQALDDERLIG